MELMLILLWMVVVLLSYQFWVLGKTHGSFLQILKELSGRIRGRLEVVDVRELKTIQAKFFRLEQQVYFRKVLGVKAGAYFQQFHKCFHKGEPSVDGLASFEDSVFHLGRTDPRPRSIIWKGLRFTLSDSIWFQTGVVPNEDVEDDQVQSMVQGPFCRGCLKRLVGRIPAQISYVPAQCHNCGLS
ncbi:hypothetical protein [Candidatus Nitrospira allomarina]|uniref:Uncharacterized protein n=1 Tax=Candidatus Nitrospira allomarina TaxID=3020900 RepID=A0AA96GC70_9BACT|nr:hypothetical protein [Candidatus Nitrospira allomarina]WNM58896.1 hypothetical protein PP769_03780 [Candidatus Nitrospira allomarina]